ncbi:MAG: tetratricopeptide repeat protein [Deltaproteobacteria bacterium]|nr:tetratricopeptide repeat protein [Deltaproteobacteria bacterium]MBW2047112.1 tetratricopeptide repeat protein [Deltaproteobacteria bacterium]MBW2109918.1 tetratricopeptide repeat protein [Deltaproteobacteria bacterium]MBW2351859.1 tetratricopeptide repeat protein [Deltaproteobacteria bacterium]HDZ89680.1 tetratricopeptide repeat protein [Deltaproteobacteria bacterium]
MLQSAWQWILEPGGEAVLLFSIIALLIGLILGSLIGSSSRKETGKALVNRGDKSFFKGIQYLLSNDHDQAIEEFTKSVQVNSDTIETYVALGNLYRSKGDIDRAIRIRHNIILRPNIDEQIKIRAIFDLAMDYRKGGFLNRALKTFLEVAEKSPGDVEVLKEIERIYEELRDWEKAYETRQKIARLDKGDHRNILAHYLVEMGKVCHEKGDLGRARALFTKAISTHRRCVDAYLHLGDLYFERQEHKKAIAVWKKVVEIIPQFTFLAYRRLEGAYSRMKNLEPVGLFLKQCARSNSDAFTHVALARYLHNENDVEGALRETEAALALDPSFWEARKFKGEILMSQGRDEEIISDYGEIMKNLNIPYLRFRCSQCGFEPDELQWKCPQCNGWDTIGLVESDNTTVEP